MRSKPTSKELIESKTEREKETFRRESLFKSISKSKKERREKEVSEKRKVYVRCNVCVDGSVVCVCV
jgi:hypothetical protein